MYLVGSIVSCTNRYTEGSLFNKALGGHVLIKKLENLVNDWQFGSFPRTCPYSQERGGTAEQAL